jgi:hypothetical protein
MTGHFYNPRAAASAIIQSVVYIERIGSCRRGFC